MKIITLIVVLVISGCSKANRVDVKLKTTGGENITLNCPVVSRGDYVTSYCYIRN